MKATYKMLSITYITNEWVAVLFIFLFILEKKLSALNRRAEADDYSFDIIKLPFV